MESFPFTKAEWQTVSEAVLPIVNATMAGDSVLHASYLNTLIEVLGGLRERYGEHPVLLETEADFVDDDHERLILYQRAVQIAVTHQLPTLSIRMSLAPVLMSLDQPAAALHELLAYECETDDADADEQANWAALVADLKNA